MDAPLERAAILAFFALAGAVVGFALGRRRPADGLVVVGGKHPGLAAAGRKGVRVSGMNSDRYRCGTCDMETTAGPLSGHQRATGHEGRFKV